MSPRSDVFAPLFSIDPDRTVVEKFGSNNEFGRSTDAVVVRYPILDDTAVGITSLPWCRRVRQCSDQRLRVSGRLR
ncbi:hypothetical protein C437_11243 [Haloarcula vallismortis ATCC 29715]|uniref:Uncharacterized protein n=1 Tax=Haloarcula vallismortis ATCC 29715 TaxID=662477 RepID=M0JG63_HALVA|nr:hypothetical protein C437_11243 [Haloarcula vallismortis ATCC 29715]